jgi:hypothetical protein
MAVGIPAISINNRGFYFPWDKFKESSLFEVYKYSMRLYIARIMPAAFPNEGSTLDFCLRPLLLFSRKMNKNEFISRKKSDNGNIKKGRFQKRNSDSVI